jgi:hypothetical protein
MIFMLNFKKFKLFAFFFRIPRVKMKPWTLYALLAAQKPRAPIIKQSQFK